MRTETIGLLVIPVYASLVTLYDHLAQEKLERERWERDARWWEYAGERAHDPGVRVGVNLE